MTKDNRVGQVEVIVFKIEKKTPYFLLLKRNSKKGGFWQAITCGIEPEEKRLDTVKRELMEETGITKYMKIIEEIYYFEFFTEKYGTLKEYVFGVEVDIDISPRLSHEHTEMKWCKIIEALELLKYNSNKEAFKKLNQYIENNY